MTCTAGPRRIAATRRNSSSDLRHVLMASSEWFPVRGAAR
jgi:hypothetical protein